MTDIELIPTDDLIQELKNRHETILICYEVAGEDFDFFCAKNGETLRVLGLLEIARQFTVEDSVRGKE